MRLAQQNSGLGAGVYAGLCRPLLCLTLGGSREGQAAQDIGEWALARHYLAVCSGLSSWHSATSTKCHRLFLFLAYFPGRPQETAHRTLSGFLAWRQAWIQKRT